MLKNNSWMSNTQPLETNLSKINKRKTSILTLKNVLENGQAKVKTW